MAERSWLARTRESFAPNPSGAIVATVVLAVMIGVVIYAAGWFLR